MIMYSHTFGSEKYKNSESKELKDDKGQSAFFEDLSNYCNDKDTNYKYEYSQFSECFKKLDEG